MEQLASVILKGYMMSLHIFNRGKNKLLTSHITSSNMYFCEITGTYKGSEIFPALKIRTNILWLSNSAGAHKRSRNGLLCCSRFSSKTHTAYNEDSDNRDDVNKC